MRRAGLMLLLSVLGLGVAGCVSVSSADTPAPGSEFFELYSGQYTDSGSFTSKTTRIVTSQGEFETELARYTSAAPVLVDFAAGKVLLVDMGERSSGGHAIGVVSVAVQPDYVVARVRLTKPGPGCVVTTALTNPWQFVQILTDREVLVEEELVVTDCAE